jgi:hypothetical protein
MSEGFLSALVGIHDIREDGGSLVARRTVLDFIGADVEDDPVTGETLVTFRQQHEVEPVTITASAQLANVNADAYRITHTDAAHILYGLTAPTTGQKHRVLIVNPHASLNLVLDHQSGSATAAIDRFIGPGAADLTISPGGFAVAIYDTTTARWRVF